MYEFSSIRKGFFNTQISFMAIFQAKNMAKMIHLISGSHIARRKAMMFVWGAPREDWPGNKILSGCFFNLTTFLKGLRGLTCCIIGNHIHIIDFSNNLSGKMLGKNLLVCSRLHWRYLHFKSFTQFDHEGLRNERMIKLSHPSIEHLARYPTCSIIPLLFCVI